MPRTERRTPELRAYGARLRAWRETQGLRQYEVAKALGLLPTSYNKNEAGDYYLHSEQLATLANKFGCDIHWLVTGRTFQGTTHFEHASKPPEHEDSTLRKALARILLGGEA